MTDHCLNLEQGGQAAAAAAKGEAVSSSADTRFPLLGTAMLCAAAALLGAAADHRFIQVAPPAPKIAFAEQGAVVLEAILDRPNMKSADANRLVGGTVRTVLDKYQRAGYLVVNVTHSADGQLLIAAIPNGAVDITPEMRTSVAHALSRAASAALDHAQ
jgi:hypothetical protein